MKTTLKAEWELFNRISIPAKTPDDLRHSHRTAYYSGALAMYHRMLDAMEGSDTPQALHAALRRLGTEAGDELLSGIPAQALKSAMLRLIGEHAP